MGPGKTALEFKKVKFQKFKQVKKKAKIFQIKLKIETIKLESKLLQYPKIEIKFIAENLPKHSGKAGKAEYEKRLLSLLLI